MRRHAHPRPLELALIDKGQSGQKKVMIAAARCSGARLVVVFEKAGELVLEVEAGSQVVADRPDLGLPQAVVEPLSSSRSPAAAVSVRGPNRPRP